MLQGVGDDTGMIHGSAGCCSRGGCEAPNVCSPSDPTRLHILPCCQTLFNSYLGFEATAEIASITVVGCHVGVQPSRLHPVQTASAAAQ